MMILLASRSILSLMFFYELRKNRDYLTYAKGERTPKKSQFESLFLLPSGIIKFFRKSFSAGIHYQEVAHSAAGTSANTASQTWKTTPTAPVAIQIEPTERTPLIKKKVTFAEPPKASKCTIFFDFKMFLIGLLLIVGFSIATYLLIVDSKYDHIFFLRNLRIRLSNLVRFIW